MLLHAVDVGTGPHTAVLLHGMMGSSESWWRVIPLLVEQRWRVLALDLPGHGLSPRDPHLTIERAGSSVAETIRRLAPEHPVVAVGHSYGATVLAEAARRLQPALAVYVDAGLALPGGQDRATLTARYERDRAARLSSEWLRRSRPFYSAQDAEVEARAASRFDPATMASISCGPDHSWLPAAGSIVVRADPSDWVSDDDVRRFEANGVEVRRIPEVAHTIWYSHFDEFTAALPELFAPARENHISREPSGVHKSRARLSEPYSAPDYPER
ncbi:alpha/beta fold hydrolase [Microbacterium hydrocarbonoxydans]|uniref:Alpha/beta hydrolase family protein n=1 Tax=Microbacterium hydrocarbonoxydans TaxID=273678 RepID=A0A1H4KBT5_9MICO|nr:alpha/beta hydrolase family protein [Microbacterium hydrocarbonoxydans]SEB56014.1 Alpha/beta hydrolase family protein [Microbacterium hydrocarbonoxydans]